MTLYRLFFLLLIIGCVSTADQFRFSKLTLENEIVLISNGINSTTLGEYFNTLAASSFRKLVLEQTNGDKLIVEQKDDNGYLVLLHLSHEQFIIEDQPSTLNELSTLMQRYIQHKDGIMADIKFY